MFNSKENGFSLIELIVVLIIMAILAQLGFTAFNRYVRRTRAFAAKTALKNIQRECESNRDLGTPETFTLLPIRGYSIATRDTNSCLGQSSDGKVAAIAKNQNEIPNFFYDFLLGQISCSFDNASNGLFNDCLTNNEVISEYNFDAKGYDLWEERGFPKDKCDWYWDVGCRHERERQALTAYYKRDLAEQVEKAKSFPIRHQEIHLDPQEERRTGNKVCRDNSGKRENCPNTNEFDKTKLETLARKHLEERKKLNNELLQKMIKNRDKQIPEIEKARAERRQQLIDRGLALTPEEVGNKSSCRDYWGWKVNCPATKELKNHQEKLKTNNAYVLEQANLKKLRDLDSYDHDAYHNSQMERGLWSQERIRNNYEREIGELYKKQQRELDEIRVSR